MRPSVARIGATRQCTSYPESAQTASIVLASCRAPLRRMQKSVRLSAGPDRNVGTFISALPCRGSQGHRPARNRHPIRWKPLAFHGRPALFQYQPAAHVRQGRRLGPDSVSPAIPARSHPRSEFSRSIPVFVDASIVLIIRTSVKLIRCNLCENSV